MKKGYSIFLSALMLITILHLSVTTHFCKGKETTSRVSLTGKLADCDMEGSEEILPLQGTYFTEHCCDDVVAFCGIDNNYKPSISFLQESYQYNFQILSFPLIVSLNSYTDTNPIYSNIGPLWALMTAKVDLANLCVFRI